jgi:hypothetical protein
MDVDGQRWQGRLAVSSSPVYVQVFDGGDDVVTGKGEGVAAPVGCWGGLGLACMNKRDGERVWCKVSARVRSDVARAGWGSIGGEGARAWEWACLGNTRDIGVLLRALVQSEGQRGGVELEVLDLGLCPEQGRWRGLGFTQEACGWGSMVGGVCLPAW